MTKVVIGLTIAAAVWSLFVWGLTALMVLAGAVLSDPGSIISYKTSWGFVAAVWIVGPVVIGLHWAAARSLGGTVALLCVALALLGTGLGIPPLRDLMLLYLGPTFLLLPLLWYRHTRAKGA